MARFSCPSCGAAYNGKRCRNCLYEHFTEEIAHGNHTHQGEPLVIDAPVRKPIRRKDPFACDPETRTKSRARTGTRTRRKKSGKSLSIAILMVVLSVIGPVLEGVFSVVEEVTDTVSFLMPEPEPDIVFPETGTALFHGDGLEVVTSWTEDQEITDSIPIYVRNDTGEDLIVSVRDVVINDCMSGGTYLNCPVRDGRTGTANLRISQADRERAGIVSVRQLRFCLDAMEEDSYKTLLYSDPVTLTPQVSGGDADVIPTGFSVYTDETVTITCLGYEIDEYHPEDVWEGTVLFHLENHTDRKLEVWTPDVTLNGEDSDLNLWTELCPNTRAVAILYLRSLEDGDPITAEEVLQNTRICFSYHDSQDPEVSHTTDYLSIWGN